MPDVPHVVIIGAGFGGLDAARALADAPVLVTLLDRHNYHLFQPLLSPADIASPIRWVLRHQKNVTVLLANVHHIDVAGNRVIVEDDGPIPYDFLIVATGSAHSYFGHGEWAARAPGLKTLDDALDIRRRVLLAFEAAEREASVDEQRRLLTFVIVGGGPTGVELAGALAEIARQSLRRDFRNIRPESAHIMLLEGAAHLLNAFPERLREAARTSLVGLGVDVRTNTVVTGVDAVGVTFRSGGAPSGRGTPDKESGGGTPDKEVWLPAQTVLWAAGVEASGIAKSLGVPLDRAGRVLAEPTLAVPSHASIFVAGDICALKQDGVPLPGVAQVAKQEGAHAARNVIRAIRGEALQPFHYRDYGNMATIGRGSAVAEIGPVKASGLFAWLIWLFIHIFWLIGFRNRIAVLSEWAWSYVTFQRRVRLITGQRVSGSGS